MMTKRYRMAVLVWGLAGSYAASAPAALVSAGDGLINDTALDITWVQDANLFQTMAQQDSTLVDAIIGLTPTYDDPSWGTRTLNAEADFNTASGAMSWWGAQAWVGYLNAVSYKGYTDWRLPGVTDTGVVGCDAGFSATDCGWNLDPGTSELGHLYYQELGNLSPYTVDGDDAGVAGGVTNAGPFTNLGNATYWTGTEDASYTYAAWGFQTSDGGQFSYDKDLPYLGWVVRDGQAIASVSPALVPLPAAFWLLFCGLGGLGWVGSRSAQARGMQDSAI